MLARAFLRSVNRNLNSSILFAFLFRVRAFIRTLAAAAAAMTTIHIQHMCIFITIFSMRSTKFNGFIVNETENHWKSFRLFLRLRNLVNIETTSGAYKAEKKVNIRSEKKHRKKSDERTHKFCEKYKLFKWFVLPFILLPKRCSFTSYSLRVATPRWEEYWRSGSATSRDYARA